MIVTISIVCSQISAFAQGQPKVNATIDSSRILIGQQFHLRLEAVTDPGEAKISWTNIPDTFNHLQVVERGKIDTVKTGKQEIYSQQVTLTGFDSGHWKIPAFDFGVIPYNQHATPAVISTDSLFIAVNTVPVDTTKPFKPIKNIRSVTVPWTSYLVYILVALIAAGLTWWLIKRRKKPERAAPAKQAPKEPPYELALKALKQLEAEKLWQNNEVKLYYTRLTDILRAYFEQQFGLSAMEQTTDELLQHIKHVTQLNQQRDNIQYILTTGDLAKFAKLQPLPDEHQLCMNKACEIVEWTKPKPVTEELNKLIG